jgi:tRNA(Ile2)-agmatinylcytidine synthase
LPQQEIVFAPHSGDPVLFGVRGDDIPAINRAFDAIRSEPWERKVLYLTNQGTDAHILQGEKISEAKDCQSYRLAGRVDEAPMT